jgi:hypothetical protein
VTLRHWVFGPEIEPLKMRSVPSVETSAMQRRTAVPSTSLHLIIINFLKGNFLDYLEIQTVFRVQALQLSDRMWSAGGEITEGKGGKKLKYFFSAVCPPQTKHGLSWDRTRAPTMRGRRIFA